MNKIVKQLRPVTHLAVLLSISCTLTPHSYQLVPSCCASSHIINGKTPEDSDDNPCSEGELIAYVESAKKSISNKWQPLKGFEDRNAVVVFTVQENGKIEDSKIVESSGSQAEDQTALDALKKASPLPPLPKGAPESIQIRYIFSWHVTHNYERRHASGEH